MAKTTEPKRMGRPPLPKDQVQSKVLYIRCTDELYAAVEAAATEEGIVNLNEWARIALKREATRDRIKGAQERELLEIAEEAEG